MCKGGNPKIFYLEFNNKSQTNIDLSSRNVHTVKFLNFRTPENFAVIYVKFKKRGQTSGYIVKKIQME